MHLTTEDYWMQVCAAVDPGLEVTWTHKDGDFVVKGTIFGGVRGAARSILVAERVALNFLQRMSGIATAAHNMVAAVEVCIKYHSTRET